MFFFLIQDRPSSQPRAPRASSRRPLADDGGWRHHGDRDAAGRGDLRVGHRGGHCGALGRFGGIRRPHSAAAEGGADTRRKECECPRDAVSYVFLGSPCLGAGYATQVETPFEVEGYIRSSTSTLQSCHEVIKYLYSGNSKVSGMVLVGDLCRVVQPGDTNKKQLV